MGRKATFQELADAIGVEKRETVRALVRDKGMPQSVEGAKAWYAANIKGESGEQSEDSGGTPYGRKLLAEAMCKEADAAKKALQLQQLRGELVEREAVDATFRKVIVAIKNRVEAIPDELATLFPPDQRSSIIADVRESIRLALMELGGLREFMGDDV